MDESLSVSKIMIKKKINELLNYKCSQSSFLFRKLCSGWTQENGNNDFLILYGLPTSARKKEHQTCQICVTHPSPISCTIYGNIVTNSVYTNRVCFSVKEIDKWFSSFEIKPISVVYIIS